MPRGIRSYGPGKYNTKLDSYVHALTLQGVGEGGIGDVGECGFYAEGILLGDDKSVKNVQDEASNDDDTLTPEEIELVKSSYAAIVVENEQGFVSVDYYSPDEKEEYESDLDELEGQAQGEEGEEEGDEEEDEEGEEADEEVEEEAGE